MDRKDYKGIWVFAEQREGVIQKVALELVATARKLAAARGAETTAVLLGSGVAKLADALVAAGADHVLVADHELLARYTTDAYTKVLCDLVTERKPEILLVGASYLGRDLGPAWRPASAPASPPTAPASRSTRNRATS